MRLWRVFNIFNSLLGFGDRSFGMSDELLPCPFCGELPIYSNGEINYIQDQGYKWGHIECGCHEVRTYYQDWPSWKDDAIAAWNTRHDTRYKTALETIMCDREVLGAEGIYEVALNALKGQENDE